MGTFRFFGISVSDEAGIYDHLYIPLYGRSRIDIPTRKGTFMLSEELILHFLPKMFKNYEIREKALLRITRNADIDTETIYDEDLDYRDAMENLIKQRRRMNPVRMELSRELNKKMISSLCKELHVDKEHVFLTRVPLDMSFVFGLQGYLRNTAQDKLFYQRRAPRMTPELDDKSALIPQIMMNDDEKGKRLTETGNYADRSLNDVKLNSQEIFYAMAYSNAEKIQKKEKIEK